MRTASHLRYACMDLQSIEYSGVTVARRWRKMKTTALWDTAECSLLDVYRRFAGAHGLHHQGDLLGHHTAQHTPEICHLHTHRRQNLIPHMKDHVPVPDLDFKLPTVGALPPSEPNYVTRYDVQSLGPDMETALPPTHPLSEGSWCRCTATWIVEFSDSVNRVLFQKLYFSKSVCFRHQM
jgi:hypothetical protein